VTRTRDGETRLGLSSVPASGESILNRTLGGAVVDEDDVLSVLPPHPVAAAPAINSASSRRSVRREGSADEPVTTHLPDDQLGGDRRARHR
jgi:hypothetical protein